MGQERAPDQRAAFYKAREVVSSTSATSSKRDRCENPVRPTQREGTEGTLVAPLNGEAEDNEEEVDDSTPPLAESGDEYEEPPPLGLDPEISEDEEDEPEECGETPDGVWGPEGGSRQTRRMPHPSEPTEEAVREHEKTHLPFRSWCRWCVLGKAKSNPHKTKKD